MIVTRSLSGGLVLCDEDQLEIIDIKDFLEGEFMWELNLEEADLPHDIDYSDELMELAMRCSVC